ncbi:aminodeoxychorismate synthase component I [Amycolatopsis alkalitolerans]|uniref:Aminodeoxychorismate synthase component I n=1 Tax=Amycolatopsis alkalitolerans TaxID=2547244 RepID=A0A5C4M966_9PSEU|nr:aminodeoxychorismate synthase component I [Amycolatopsis alkalitolerans]TNC29504.1 aminodeoxychorismate synthase component I [Amycolatopsis alkalitolerans]
MRFVRKRLRGDRTADEALASLTVRARKRGVGAAGGLCGDWFGAQAVLAPEVRLGPVADPFAPLRNLPRVPGDGVGGGWFGYLAYDLTDPSGRSTGIPRAVWGWADHVLRLDAGGQWWFEALTPDVDPAEFESLLAAEPPRLTWEPTSLERPLPNSEAVKACIHAIEAGELFQANICTRFTGRFSGDPAGLFAAGVRALAPRRAAYLEGRWGAIVSLSPELFLARHGDSVRSAPIKGTLPRRGPEDEHLRARLRESVKDVAENVMITDLVRNDLGRVCEVGSVRVPELLAVRPAPGVWHLESTVEGRLRGTDEDLLAAAFPPGSVTGAPKIRALELIAELEPSPRGVYTGAVGLVSPVAGLELNVAIRTFEISGGHIALGVGGGITAGSDPAAEWAECLHKAALLEQLLATQPTPRPHPPSPEPGSHDR